jgi:hypothetical protein
VAQIVIGLELLQHEEETARLLQCAVSKLLGGEAEPDTSAEIMPVMLVRRDDVSVDDVRDEADRALDECADALGIADRRELVLVIRE